MAEKFSKKMKIGISLILLIGFSMIFLGSFFTFKYGRNWEMMLLPYPTYSTEETVTGVLTSENPNFTLNVSYYSVYNQYSYFGVEPCLKGYLEANDTLNFCIKIIKTGIFEVGLRFNASNISATNFSAEAKYKYSGSSVWALTLQKNSTGPVNFTIHYYQEVHGFTKFLASQTLTLSETQILEYKSGFWIYAYYKSSWLYINVKGDIIFIAYSLGGVWNSQIVDNAYKSIFLGMIIVAFVLFFLVHRISGRKKDK